MCDQLPSKGRGRAGTTPGSNRASMGARIFGEFELRPATNLPDCTTVSALPIRVELEFGLLYDRILGRKASLNIIGVDYDPTLLVVPMELVFVDLRAESLLICGEPSANTSLVVSNS